MQRLEFHFLNRIYKKEKNSRISNSLGRRRMREKTIQFYDSFRLQLPKPNNEILSDYVLLFFSAVDSRNTKCEKQKLLFKANSLP